MTLTALIPFRTRTGIAALTTALMVLCPTGLAQALEITSASGANAAAIQAAVDTFRTDLGTLNPNVAGSFGSGRREINWDGVSEALSDPNLLPNNFSTQIRRVVWSFPRLVQELRSARTPAARRQYCLAVSTRLTPTCFKYSVHRSYSPQSVRTL